MGEVIKKYQIGGQLEQFYTFLTSRMPVGLSDTSISKNAKNLISRLLDSNPSTRLGSKGVNEIKNHPFFKDFNWIQAEQKELTPPISFQVEGEDEEYLYRAPTIVAEIKQPDFHQNSMVKPSLKDLDEPAPLHSKEEYEEI